MTPSRFERVAAAVGQVEYFFARRRMTDNDSAALAAPAPGQAQPSSAPLFPFIPG